MSAELIEQLASIDGDSFGAILTSAMAVACADGELDENEVNELAQSLNQLMGNYLSYEDLFNLISNGIQAVAENGVDGAIGTAAQYVEDDTLKECALLVASATAWAARGVNTKEGLALQKLARELGIGQNRYFELLGVGKQLVG